MSGENGDGRLSVDECRTAATRIASLVGVLEDEIANLVENGSCAVELEVHFNDGEESVRLHRLSGEIKVAITREEDLT